MKIKKILLSLLIILFSITSFTSNTYAFSTSEKEADTIRSDENENNEKLRNGLLGACTPMNDFVWHSIGNLYDASGHKLTGEYLGRFTNPADAFCIEPDAMFSSCEPYEAGSFDSNIEIAKILGAYHSGSQDDAHFAAAQILLWEQLGTYRSTDTPGYEAAMEDIKARKDKSNTSVTTYAVKFNKHSEILNLNENDSSTDTTSLLTSRPDKFSVNTNVSGLDVSVSGNTVTATLTQPYPKTKKIVVNAGADVSTGSEVSSISGFHSSKAQDIVVTGDYVNNIHIDHFEGDTFTLNTSTGDLKVVKLDEYGQIATADNVFEIYFADDNIYKGTNADTGEGQYQQEDGTTQWKTNADGQVLIQGEIPDGNYILKEVATTNEYELNEVEVPFTVERGQETEIKFINNMRTVEFEVFKHDIEEEYRYLNDAEFSIYDVTGIWNPDDVIETDNLFFIKSGKSINVRDFYLDNNSSIKAQYGSLPMTFSLSNDVNGTIDANNIFTAGKVGLARIKATGGKYSSLYAKYPNGKDAIQDVLYNPLDIKLYYDESGTKEVDVKSIEIVNSTLDITTLGTYSVEYEIIDAKGVKYNVLRDIDVIVDNTPIFDTATSTWRDPITNKVVEDPSITNDKSIYPFYKPDESSLPEGYDGKVIGEFGLYVVTEDTPLSANDTFVYKGVKMFRGQTGHTYLQIVDKKNHNLPLANTSVQIYHDPDLLVSFGEFETDEYGVVDFGTSYNSADYAIETTVLESETEVISTPVKTITIEEESPEDYKTKIDEVLGLYEDGFIIMDEKGLIEYTFTDLKDDTFITENSDTEGKIKLTFKVMKIYNPEDYEEGMVYFGIGEEVYKTKVFENDTGKVNAPYLKHSRDYLVCETKLPEGYDYVEDIDPCFMLDTSTYEVGVDKKDDSVGNKVRRLDMVVYKTNDTKTIKLNGAIFDIWDIFEEGQDFNVIKHIKDVLVTNQLTEYEPTALGQLNITEEDPTGIADYISDEYDVIIVDEEKDESTSAAYKQRHTHTGTRPVYGDDGITPKLDGEGSPIEEEYEYQDNNAFVYKVYKPDTIERKYLGRFISGGFYITYKDALENAQVELFSDFALSNKIKTISLNSDKTATVLGLPDGKYYYKLARPIKPDFEPMLLEAPEGYHLDEDINSPTYGKAINDLNENDVIEPKKVIHIPTEEDYIPLDELPDCYRDTNEVYVAEGMIMLPEIKYGRNLLYKEIQAPNGYYFDNSNMLVEVKAEYGINRVENFRINNAIIIYNTGVK